ncbi:MAG: flagellar assembly protein FliW [Clostridia bacterium]|jgi:flagellar assembly factor FliW|nr:flagellar assembly protein FliW [Clostridia bacterium]
MTLNTRHFGEISIDVEKVVRFEEGLPGFEDKKDFILLSNEESNTFFWLQSVEDGEVAFALANPFIFYPEYSPEINDEYISELGELKEEDLNIYSVLVVPEDIKKMSANLKAPIVINNKTRKGKQVIVENKECEVRHFVYDDMEKVKANMVN